MSPATTRAWPRLAEALAFFVPGGRDPALPGLGLPALRPRLAQPGLVSERIATLSRLLDEADAAAHRADHGERAGAARAAARGVRRGQHEPRASTARCSRRTRRIPGSQRLRPRRHGDGAGRIRHARRHHRHVPGRRGRPGAARPVRRHHRDRSGVFDPDTQRSGDALPAADAAPGLRSAARQAPPSPASAPAGASCSASRRRRTRSTSRSPRAAAIPAWSTGCRCSTSAWRRCSTTCPAPRSAWTTRPTRCWRRGWR